MLPWKDLNYKGRILAVCVFINMYVSILYATQGSYIAILPASMAMVCGISTYRKKYQQTTADEINERAE